MDLALSTDCPIFQRHNQLYLNRLLDTLVRGWHTLATPYPSELVEILSPEIWDSYGDVLSQDLKTATRAFRPLVRPVDCGACDADHLSRFLSMPTILLVENPRSDGGFLEEVVARLRPRMRSSMMSMNRSVDIRHGGGISEIPKEIRRLSTDYINLAPPGFPPRFIVLADSDAKYAGDRSEDALRVERVSRSVGVAVHILEKRSIENYIPDEPLREYARTRTQHREAVEIITGLQGEARDYYPMKDGLPKDQSKSREHEPLYPPGLPRAQGLANFVVDFLETSQRHLTRQNLMQRDHSGDLSVLLDILEGNI